MLSINAAFRLRNKLKETIARLKALVERADYDREEGAEENRSKLDGRTLEETIAEAVRLMNLLCDFNQAIEKANQVNRADLVTLDTVRAKIALYEEIAEKCRAFVRCTEKTRRMATGEFETIKVLHESLLDQAAAIKTLDALKKEKDELEETLARHNYEITVDFDGDLIRAAL
jgi:hypothetical protein